MSVVIYRKCFPHDKSGDTISWRLQGEALPQGSVPIRFVMSSETPELKLHDLLYVPDEQYRASLDRATAQGLLRDNWTDLCDRTEGFWDEYLDFVALHFPEAIPFSIAKGNRKDDFRNERRHVLVIKGLVRAGASINLVFEGKTALDYAIGNNKTIPYDRLSGKCDYTRAIIECLRNHGAITAAEVNCCASP